MPDKGEELALSRLIQFADSIAKIYPPGIIIWIVSDGHVFSDCIGVDDSKVNRYFQGLQNLYQNLKPKDSNPIRFVLCQKFSSVLEILVLMLVGLRMLLWDIIFTLKLMNNLNFVERYWFLPVILIVGN